MADGLAVQQVEDFYRIGRSSPIVEALVVYITPRRFNIMSMMAITIRVWIQLPVFGNLGLMFRPKKPRNHRMTNTMTIIHISDIRFLLF